MAKVSAKNTVILVNGYNFSSYFSAFDVNASANPAEVTGFGEGAKNYVPTMPSGNITGTVFWDSAAAKTHLVFSAMPTGHVTLIPEGYTVGNPSISMPFVQSNYAPKGSTSSVLEVGTLNFESYGNNAGVEYGWALQHATITDTTTSTAVLDPTDAAVTAACSGTLHVWSATEDDTYVVKIQHCATAGGVYADLVTFTLNGTALTSERVAVASGTINKYRKVVATRTGSDGESFGFTVHFWHG